MIVKPMTHVLIIIVEAIFKGPIFTLIKDKLADVTRTQKFYFLQGGGGCYFYFLLRFFFFTLQYCIGFAIH